MPKKNEKQSNRLIYDVSRVVLPGDLKPLDLTRLERSAIIKSFQPHNPSDKFFNDYEHAVQFFIWDVEEVQKVTPAKVSARINGIHKNVQQLLSDLLSLEISDQSLLDRHSLKQFLQDRKSVSVNRFISYLTLFIESTAEAVLALDDVQKSGRLPAYAEQCLAVNIGRAIQDETGKPPPLTRNGVFSQVLKCALSVGDKKLNRRSGTERSDVMDLMRYARKTMAST